MVGLRVRRAHLRRQAAENESAPPPLPQGRKSSAAAGKQAQCFGLEKPNLAYEH